MTLLALAVAGYAAVLLCVPELRPSFFRTLLAEHPFTTMAHLAGSALTLPTGALQLNARCRARFIGAHRWLGRLYALGVVLGGLSGLFLAMHASGGPVAQAGFGLLAVCWLGSTFNAYRDIRAGHVHAHRCWMLRSYALTLAAVTLRFYVPISQIAGISFFLAYPAIAWLSWVPNLLIAQRVIKRSGVALADPARKAGVL